ncbi:MAG: hypothetical protein IJ809_05210, partial [Clostridia bacterium]|nr:hypothetical protein [Clostridia bacterium]
STPNGMTLYIGESISSCSELASTGITVTSNKPVYAVFKDSTGQYGGAAIGNVEYIDKVVPVINSIDVTTNTLTINATDSGGSNLAKYAISTVDVEPDENDFQVSNVFSVSQTTAYFAWAMDGAGNVSASATNTTATVQTPTVTFTYDPSGWTNEDVTVTAVASSTPEGMTLYIGESVSSCDTLASTGITVTSNKPVYAVFKDSSGQFGGAATGNVEYIDKVVPVINSIDVTTNTLTINASDSGGSNLAKYAISTVDVEPDENDFQVSNVFSVSQGVAYYAWAMDGAGNVSVSATNTTATIQTPTVTFTYDPSGWTNKDVKVTAVATSTPAGMTLYIGESISSCSTLASTGITVTSNKPVYAVFKDSSEQFGGAATGNVEYIDKAVPSITTTSNSGAYDITIKGRDTLAGINAYYYSTSNSTPSLTAATSSTQAINKWVTFTASTSEISKTLTGFTSEGTYYYWFKDQAGNISARGTFTTTKVPASSVKYVPETSGWNSGDVQDAIDKLYEKFN